MKSWAISGLTGMVIIAGAFSLQAQVLKPVYSPVELKKDRAVMYFDSKNRMNVKVFSQFEDACGLQPTVQCIYAESSNSTDAEVSEEFKGNANKNLIYRGQTDKQLPHMEFYKDNTLVGTLEQQDNLIEKPAIYLDYLAGFTDANTLASRLKATDSADLYKKIVPKMNFVLMLAKKGERDNALKELSSIDATQLDDKGKLIFAQTYLRLKAPDKAMEILKDCKDNECVFYFGIAKYVAGDVKGGIYTLKGLKSKYSDVNRLNYYLKEMYKADGDKKHADEIKLPNNYNINAD